MADGGLEAVKALIDTLKPSGPAKCGSCGGKTYLSRWFVGRDEDGQVQYEYEDCTDCRDVNGKPTGFAGGRLPLSRAEAKLVRDQLAKLGTVLAEVEASLSNTGGPLHNEPDETPLGKLLCAVQEMRAALSHECDDEVRARVASFEVVR